MRWTENPEKLIRVQQSPLQNLGWLVTIRVVIRWLSVVRIHHPKPGRTGVSPNQKNIVHRLGEYLRVGVQGAKIIMEW